MLPTPSWHTSFVDKFQQKLDDRWFVYVLVYYTHSQSQVHKVCLTSRGKCSPKVAGWGEGKKKELVPELLSIIQESRFHKLGTLQLLPESLRKSFDGVPCPFTQQIIWRAPVSWDNSDERYREKITVLWDNVISYFKINTAVQLWSAP